MIPHRKHALFNRLFVAHARSRLRGTFSSVRVVGTEHAVRTLRDGPAVVVANHTAWWDSLVLMWLSNHLLAGSGPSDGFALMDARSLRRFPFFGLLGVFGVELDDPEDRAAVLAYAAGLLREPGDHVWIFPQGAERPVTEPLHFHRGAAVLAARAGVPVLPVALRFEHGRHERPEAYVAFGEALRMTGDEGVDVHAQEAAVRALMDTLEEAVRAAARRQDAIPVALPGRRALPGVLAERVLSLIVGRGNPHPASDERG